MSAPGAEPRVVRPWHAALGLVAAAVLGHGGGVVAGFGAVAVTLVLAAAPLAGLTPEALLTFPVIAASAITTETMLVVVAVAVPLLARAPVGDALGLRRAPVLCFVLAVVGVLALGPTSDAIVMFAREHFPRVTFGTLEGLDRVLRDAPVWAAWPVIAIAPGLGEELVFRGMFQRAIPTPALAIVLSAVLFSAFHIDPQQALGTLPTGFYLAWLAWRTRSTFVPILGHVANNTAALAVAKNDALRVEVLPWWVVVVGLGVAILALVALEAVRPRAPRAAPPVASA